MFVAAECNTIGYTGEAGACTCAAGYEGTVTYDVATGATGGCTGQLRCSVRCGMLMGDLSFSFVTVTWMGYTHSFAMWI